MVIVNLTDLGPVPHCWATREELAEIYAAAEAIMADTAEADLDAILDSWTTTLTWRSLEAQPVDEAWYTRALLVVALRGIRGESPPKFHWINDV